MFAEDKAAFLQADGFAGYLTPETGSPILAVIDAGGAEANGIAGRRLRAITSSETAAGIAVGSVFYLGSGEEVAVSSVRPSMEGGFSELLLESRGTPVIVEVGAGILSAIWIDETDPNYPVVELPGSHDPYTYTLSGGAGAGGRILLAWSDLRAAVPLPGRILAGELRFWAYAQSGTPAWSTAPILQGISNDLSGVCWSRFRAGAPWSVAGCGALGVDYSADAVGAGPSVGASWVSFAAGRDFNSYLLAHLGGGALVIRATSAGLALLQRDPAPRLYLRTITSEVG